MHIYRWIQRTRSVVAAGSAAALVLVSACGTNVDHDEVVAAGNGGGANAVGPAADTGATDSAGAPAPAGGVDTAAAQPRRQGAPSDGATNAAAANGSREVADSAKTAGPTAASDAPAPVADKPCAKSLSPIKLGQTMASSGLIGAGQQGLRPGIAVWAAAVNARGGVQCHPIALTQLDDGSDPTRVATNVNQLIHQQKVAALIAAGVPLTSAAMRAAVERERFPVIGGELVSTDWYQSQYMFPQGGHPLDAYFGAYQQASRATNGGKVGLIYCVEASICSELQGRHEENTRNAGLQLGPAKAVSLTQPDYSAECKLMKDAGVQVLWLAVEGSAATRLARGCAALNYRPLIATTAIILNPQAVADKNLQSFGVVLGHNVAPFVTSEIAGVAELVAAMAKFSPKTVVDQAVMLGWSSGKLFEAALAKVADQARAGDVTTQMIMEGLWKLKEEKLDGLSAGVTFGKGKLPSAPPCYFSLKLTSAGWSAPEGGKPVCNGKKPAAAAAGTQPGPAVQHRHHPLPPARELAVLGDLSS
ncbi:MAG: ABC transporter substrate-binding protein [Sporichthyaceae bacterium]